MTGTRAANELGQQRRHRRDVLKTIGIGTAAMWSAPVVSGLGARAWADTPADACLPPCPDWTCGAPITECGEPAGGFAVCVCDQTVEGDCFCWNDYFCGTTADCTSSEDCPAGQACVTNCCGTTCAPVCGTQPAGVQAQVEGAAPVHGALTAAGV